MVALLANVAYDPPGMCGGCGAEIYWIIHRNGRRVPYTVRGLNHFVDCPAREDFRKKATPVPPPAEHPADSND